jgi:hypothetical protein
MPPASGYRGALPRKLIPTSRTAAAHIGGARNHLAHDRRELPSILLLDQNDPALLICIEPKYEGLVSALGVRSDPNFDPLVPHAADASSAYMYRSQLRLLSTGLHQDALPIHDQPGLAPAITARSILPGQILWHVIRASFRA